MEDFKSNPKMQCFKEGGSVKYESRKEHKEEMKSDINQDKKIVKKAIAMHDKQEHKGEKTDLSKLKKGGRAKKDCGTVRKYKTGGAVENAYGAKKTDKDIKDIANSKNQKPKMLCGGGKSYADGGSVFDTIKAGATKLKENLLGTDEQNRVAQESMDKQAQAGSKLAKFLGGKADAESAPVKKCGGGKMKRGGKVC